MIRRLVVLTDGQRIEVAEQGITFLELRTVAQVLLHLADGAIEQAASAGSGLLQAGLAEQQAAGARAEGPHEVE